jgi:excisionase family DNA binding protein
LCRDYQIIMATQIMTILEQEEFLTLLSERISTIVKVEFSSLQSQAEPIKRILTRKEAAQLLDISLPTLHDYTKRGLIPAYRISSKVRYKLEDLEQALVQIKTGKARNGF